MTFSQFPGPSKKELGIVSTGPWACWDPASSFWLSSSWVRTLPAWQSYGERGRASSRGRGSSNLGCRRIRLRLLASLLCRGYSSGMSPSCPPWYSWGPVDPSSPSPGLLIEDRWLHPLRRGLLPRRRGNPPSRPNRKDAARAEQLVVVGDRLFRGNNIKKAEERYLQAARLDPSSAAPLVRLAQIALVRDQFAEAARRLREAETAQPGWIATAPRCPVALRRARGVRSPPGPPGIPSPGASRRSGRLAGARGPVVSLRPNRPRGGRVPSP